MGMRERFREAALAPPTDGRLAEAALCIAALGDPLVDVDAELVELARLAEGCPGDIAGLRVHLFDKLGFRGATRHYRDPRNSFLHEVRRRRRGIPISLCVLAMEVGRHAGVPLVGVGMPRHFLARSADDPSLYLDAFSGRLLSPDGVRLLFRTLTGGVELDDRWLEPVDNVAILRRILNNLREAFARDMLDLAVLWTLDLELMLPDVPLAVRLARAGCLIRLYRVDEAAEILEEMAQAEEDEETAARLRQHARLARSVLQ